MTDPLPPLPDSGHYSNGPFGQSVLPWFSADQMRAYAAAAVAAEREACATHIDVPLARPGAEFAAAIRARKP